MVRANVRVRNRGKNANFVQSVFLFFVGQFAHFDLLERICLAVVVTLHRVHTAVGALPCTNVTLDWCKLPYYRDTRRMKDVVLLVDWQTVTYPDA